MSSLDLPLHQTVIASTAAGISSTLLGHPIDTLKVHLQTNPALSSKSIGPNAGGNKSSRFISIRAAQHLLRSNGYSPRVFFRGIGPPIFNAAALNILTFTCFNQVKEWFATTSTGGTNDSKINANTYVASLTAGVVSGFLSAFVSTPTDYVKIQSQLRGISSAAVLREIAHNNNSVRQSAAILFRGNVMNLGREGVFTMVYLGLYDVGMSASFAHHETSGNTGTALGTIAAISSLTGALAWVASYPFDTAKSVMQGGAPSSPRIMIREAIRKILQTADSKHNGDSVGRGYAAFYRGCWASTGRAMLVTSSRMITYEWVARAFFKGEGNVH